MMLVARIICAATGSDRVSIKVLLSGCSAIPALRGFTATQIGRALAGTGWEASQWRVDGSRVRGYRALGVTGEGPRKPD